MCLFNLTRPFLEKDIEEAIFKNGNILRDRGFAKLYKNVYRQFVLPSGKVIDIFAHEMIAGRFHGQILELKRGAIDQAALSQTIGHLDEVIFLTSQCYAEFHFECVLAGTSIAPNIKNISFKDPAISIYQYSFELDGVWFTKHEPQLVDLAISKAEQKAKS